MQAAATQGQITYEVSSLDGQHFVFDFSEPVIFDGSLTAFRIFRTEDSEFFVPVAVAQNGPAQIIWNLGGGEPGTYVIVPSQPLTSVRGYTGNLVTGQPLLVVI
jgi:hypothetical protein